MANLNSPITLPVLWHTENSFELSNLGLETDEHTIKKITFYSIDLVYEYEHDGNSYTKLWSGGSDYIITDNIRSINQAIISKLT